MMAVVKDLKDLLHMWQKPYEFFMQTLFNIFAMAEDSVVNQIHWTVSKGYVTTALLTEHKSLAKALIHFTA